MAIHKLLQLSDSLPLTCTRSGTCCHGKNVRLNPWELACFAHAKQISARDFHKQFCDPSGIFLRFEGPSEWRGMKACCQYVPGAGCAAHQGRPLACRLYPLGRQRQGTVVQYMYQGSEFPCLQGCPDVVTLPQFTVENYIAGQQSKLYEDSQDSYLEVMQNLADIAFVLLLESDLVKAGDRNTLRAWRALGLESPEQLALRLGSEWLDALQLPDIALDPNQPLSFSMAHNELLVLKANQSFGAIQSNEESSKASITLMGLALHLGRSLGADPATLSERWIKTAKTHGARD